MLPEPGDPDGLAYFGIDPQPQQKKVCYQLEATNLDPITGAYIPQGRSRRRGSREDFALFEDPEGIPGDGRYEGCATDLKKRLIKRIAKQRSSNGEITFDWTWYADIRTTEYPDGAVRGQLGAGMPCSTCHLDSAKADQLRRRRIARAAMPRGPDGPRGGTPFRRDRPHRCQ